jgi:hypothetical protein
MCNATTSTDDTADDGDDDESRTSASAGGSNSGKSGNGGSSRGVSVPIGATRRRGMRMRRDPSGPSGPTCASCCPGGWFVFACFNQGKKINPVALDIWVALLQVGR